jgi:hypothetical protein
MVDANTDHSVPKGSLYKRDMTSMFEMSSPRNSEGNNTSRNVLSKGQSMPNVQPYADQGSCKLM